MNIKNALLCSIVNYKKWTVNPKIHTLFALIPALTYGIFPKYTNMQSWLEKNVSPWIFPHLFTLPVMMPVYGCFAMLLFAMLLS